MGEGKGKHQDLDTGPFDRLPNPCSLLCSALDGLTGKVLNAPGHSNFYSVTEMIPFCLSLDQEAESLGLNLSTSTSEGVTLGKVAFLSFSPLIC